MGEGVGRGKEEGVRGEREKEGELSVTNCMHGIHVI